MTKVKRVHSIMAFLALSLVACGDSTSPRPFALELTIATPTAIVQQSSDGPTMNCAATIVAQARGVGKAIWGMGKFRWFAGADRRVPFDSSTVFSGELVNGFGGEEINAGETKSATWHFSATASFEVEVEFAYEVDASGKETSAKARFVCGPRPQAGALPTVNDLVVVGGKPELEPGDTVSAIYEAASTSNLWVTSLAVTGAFQAESTFTDYPHIGVRRMVQFVIPPTAQLGQSITFTAYATNPALELAERRLQSGITVRDRTPPTALQIGLGGQYAVGENITFSVTGSDKGVLKYLVYELGPPVNVRDSVATPYVTGYYTWDVSIPVQPTWVGTAQLSVWVRDAAGLESVPMRTAPDSLRFYPTVNRPTALAPSLAPAGIDDIVYDPKRDLAYFAVWGSRIPVLSLSTMTWQTPIALNSVSAGLDLTLSGDTLVAAMSDAAALALIDLASPSAAPRIISLRALIDSATGFGGTYGPGANPEAVQITATGKAIVAITPWTSSRHQMIDVDLVTGAARVRRDVVSESSVPHRWAGLAAHTPDRSRLVFMGWCALRYDSASDHFDSCTQRFYELAPQINFDRTGALMSFDRFVFDSEMRMAWRFPTFRWPPPNAAISPDGTIAYVAWKNFLIRVRLADGVMLDRSPMPIEAQSLYVAPSGAWLLAMDRGQGRVVRVDLR